MAAMRYRTALLTTVAVCLFMFVVEWSVLIVAQKGIESGITYPEWFRFFVGISLFWRILWPLVALLLLGILMGVAALSQARRHRSQLSRHA
jgi:hypothetical protein